MNKNNNANDAAATNTTADALRKGKVIKSLTLPRKTANLIKTLAEANEAKQTDIVKVAVNELNKKDEAEINKLFIDYEVY